MGLLICVAWAPFLVKRVFQNVSNFAAEGNLLALVTTDNPRGLRVFEDNNERAFFMKTRSEPLLKFADKANIVVINKQYILFYDKSQAKLLNTGERYFDDIPVGADMMHFENPWLLALDGTTFTKYDIKGKALQRYTFEAAVRVIPDNRWSSFALHYSEILDYHPHIQYVSRGVDQELNIASQALEYILPKVLIQLVQSYLPGFSPEIPKSPADVFATITSVRIRRESDLSAREPKMIATHGIYTAIVQEDSIFVVGGKLETSKEIDSVANPETLDFDFLTQEIVVLSEPPNDVLRVRYINSSDGKNRNFCLGIPNLERASFYRDGEGALHLMALTKTLTYDYIIGHQEITKGISPPGQPTTPNSTVTTHSIHQS